MDEANALASLARLEAIPNLEVGLLAEREATSGRPRVGVGVNVPFPLWNRNQGVIQERRALSGQATFRRQAVELAVRTQVTDAYRAYESASEEARIFETDVLAAAHTNQGLLETAFLAGKVGLTTVVLLRNQLLDAELGYWDAWLTARHALVDLDAATGTLDAPQVTQPSGDR